MSQTTVLAGGQPIGVAGQLADTSTVQDIVSGFNGEASSQIPFGYGVRVDPSSTGDRWLLATGYSGSAPGVLPDVAGAVIYTLTHSRAGNADPNGFFSGDMGGSGLLAKSSMEILRRGRILVPVEAAVLPGDRPYCRGIPTGSLTAGIWAGSGYGQSYHIDCTKMGVFRSASYTAADGVTKVAVLDVDFTSKP